MSAKRPFRSLRGLPGTDLGSPAGYGAQLAAVAGLRKEAMFVGRLNKFEIWEPGRFNKNNKGNEAVAAAAIKNLNL